MTSTDAGITISTNAVLANACFPIRENLDPDSNVSEVSDPHSRKQHSPKISIDKGITISIKPVSLNAPSSIRDDLDPDSNLSHMGDRH
jgi:hypothetical protein